jgi:hypothetical protein
MKAPDKIYIQTNAGEAISSKWTTIPFRDFENTAYIRKDALLEWAKECFRLQDGGSWYSKGAADAFSKVIEKINSL